MSTKANCSVTLTQNTMYYRRKCIQTSVSSENFAIALWTVGVGGNQWLSGWRKCLYGGAGLEWRPHMRFTCCCNTVYNKNAMDWVVQTDSHVVAVDAVHNNGLGRRGVQTVSWSICGQDWRLLWPKYGMKGSVWCTPEITTPAQYRLSLGRNSGAWLSSEEMLWCISADKFLCACK